MENKTGVINLLLLKRLDFIKFIVGAIVLASGISLLSNYFTEILKLEWLLLFGVILTIFCLLYFFLLHLY